MKVQLLELKIKSVYVQRVVHVEGKTSTLLSYSIDAECRLQMHLESD